MRLLLGALRLFVYRALWYWLGITSAGRALVRALGSPDENIRSIAGILLAKSGKRAEPLLQEALNRRCLLYTSPSPRDGLLSRMPSSA